MTMSHANVRYKSLVEALIVEYNCVITQIAWALINLFVHRILYIKEAG